MLRDRTKDEYIERLTAALVRDFGNTCDPDRIAAAVRAEYEELCARSRVHAFVPILAERKARRRLTVECRSGSLRGS